MNEGHMSQCFYSCCALQEQLVMVVYVVQVHNIYRSMIIYYWK